MDGQTPDKRNDEQSGLHDFWCDEPKCVGPCNCRLVVTHCPQCQSPYPFLHPTRQNGAVVATCPDRFHEAVSND